MAAIAAAVSFVRAPQVDTLYGARRVKTMAAVAIVAHCIHFAEELHTGFYVEFPALFGLAPWPVTFFVAFNVTMLVIWAMCAVLLQALPRISLFPLWFLAIAAIANGIVHPLLSLDVGAYFPGLWSSPLVAVFGLLLMQSLAAFTRPSTS